MEKKNLACVSIPSPKLRLFLKEWLGYIVVTEEELNNIMTKVLDQALGSSSYVLSNPQIHYYDDYHIIGFLVKDEKNDITYHLEATVYDEEENTLNVKCGEKLKEYHLKEDFYLAPVISERQRSFCQIDSHVKGNYYEVLIEEDDCTIKIGINTLKKGQVNQLINIQGLEDSLRGESFWGLSLSSIIEDIFYNSFDVENFKKLRITLAVCNSEEEFKAVIYNGIMGNVSTKSDSQNYHFTQKEETAVPWNFSDVEFKGVGEQIKPAMKVLARIKNNSK